MLLHDRSWLSLGYLICLTCKSKRKFLVSLFAWVTLIIPGARAHEAAASTSRRTVRSELFPLQTAGGKAVTCHLVTLGFCDSGQLLQSLSNNVETLLKLLFSDDEGRRKADDISVGWLGLEGS